MKGRFVEDGAMFRPSIESVQAENDRMSYELGAYDLDVTGNGELELLRTLDRAEIRSFHLA